MISTIIERRDLGLLAVALLLTAGCATLPERPALIPIHALPAAPSGVLSEFAARFAAKHGRDQSGFAVLEENREALLWRLALIDEAQVSIDAQYFIWQNDETANLLFDRLIEAADRGVRVRLLVDDLVFAADERAVTAITTHPNFDLRIFNPGKVRGSFLGATSEFLLRFRELNRRMHNKLFIADNHLAIVGGRNIGNEYFGLARKYNFRDLDVLVAGEVLGDLSRSFDKFWNAELSYPGSAMSKKVKPGDLDRLRVGVDEYIAEKSDVLVSYPLRPRSWRKELMALPETLMSGRAQFIQDEPVLIGDEEYRLEDMLRYIARPAGGKVTVVSPYFIPSKEMLGRMTEIASKGVKVSILTASMASNNHTAAHSHYRKYRRRILATGAELFEFKHQPSADLRAISDVPPVEAGFISLHVKAIVADGEKCFVGSLNLDPRALELNTENGLYIESGGLCGELDRQFAVMMSPENAWQVFMNPDYTLRWESSEGTVPGQPARGFGQRIADFFLRLLPIEGQM
jgi:putative cardiolipin synthase